MEEQKEKKQGGKRPGQKFKSLLVWNLLLKRTDENHAAGIKEIQALLEDYGIEAERHSVSRDIKDLMELLNKDQDVMMEDRDLLNYEVEYDAELHGYKVVRRPYEFDDLRLLAECVRASKFISQKQEESLLAAIEGLCSEHQVKELKNEVYLVGRSKTANRWIMGSMLTINQAIRDNVKIGFKYQKNSLSNRSQQVDRRKGAEYIFSPYKLIINDGNYYLLAYDSKRQMMKTFRLDRMREVKMKNEARDGQEVYVQMDMQTYCLQHFGMFSGEKKRVQLRFTNNLLDTMVDRFGTGADVLYGPDGDRHFIVTTEIAISDQFFGWLCGFRKMAKIVSPPDVVADFQKFLDDISGRYETE